MTFSGERLDAVVAEAVAGNRDALREVLEIIRPIVVRYCRARVGSTERSGLSADDVAQEVCLAAITALPRYKDQGRPFLAFVYGIAAHKVADAHRAAARNRSDPTDVVPERFSLEAGPEQMAMDAESAARMNKLLAVLPEQQVYATDSGEAELAQLLAGWRDEVREPPLMAPVTPRDAAVALTRALESRKRTRTSMALVGSVAAAVLCLGGFGAVVAGAGPGDPLYGLHTMLFGEQPQTRTDQVSLASQQLAEVQQLID